MNSGKTIYYFNPTCEMAVANGSPYYQAPAILRDFEECLAPIMFWFAEEGDLIVSEKTIDVSQIEILERIGKNNIQTIPRKEAFNILLEKNEKVKLSPWGWSPAFENRFRDIQNISENFQKKESSYYKKRYERKNSIELLKSILEKINSEHLLSIDKLPQIIYSEEEVENQLLKWGKIVLKSPVSSSGRGLQVIRRQPLNQSKREWINTTLKQQSYLTCEALLEKVADFSFQFFISDEKEVNYLGLSSFKTNDNGQYNGHNLNFTPKIIDEFIDSLPPGLMEEVIQQLTNGLQETAYAEFESFISIDALIFKEEEKFKLYPCIEINPRINMGALSLKIKKHIHPKSKGYFGIYNGKDFANFSINEAKKNPPKLVDGKLFQGFYSLSELNSNQRFGAYINLNAD